MSTGERWAAENEHANGMCKPETCPVCAFVRRTVRGILAEQEFAAQERKQRRHLRLVRP